MNLKFYRIIGNVLTEGIEKSYKAGLASIVKLNKKEILRLKDDDEPEMFKINYTGTDKELLEYFKTEAFEVAAVSSKELEDKLKKLAADIMEGNHPLAKGEKNIKNIWTAEAQNLIGDYVPVKDMPPPSQLNTNLQTAMNAAFHGSRYNRLQDPSIKELYPAYQYKTRKDSRVRDEHRALDDKIFYSDDGIWKSIIPPNGWNCRCYYNPLNQDEVNSEKNIIHPITTEEERVNIIREAKIAKNFNKNPAIHKSIYGKWLDDKGEALGIFTIMKKTFKENLKPDNYFKDKKALEIFLDENTAPFRYIEPTLENWVKEVPENKLIVLGYTAYFNNKLKIKDREGTFTTFEKLIEKGKDDGRHLLMGLIKPTLSNPLIVIKDHDALIFVKSFKTETGRIDYNSIAYEKGDLLEIVSNYGRDKLEKLFQKVRDGEVLVFSASSSEKTGFSSRGTSHSQPGGLANLPKLESFDHNYNELWSMTAFKGRMNNLEANYIYYLPDGVKVIKKVDNEFKKPIYRDYSELDNYRIGVPL